LRWQHGRLSSRVEGALASCGWMERWLETCEKHVPDVGLSLNTADISWSVLKMPWFFKSRVHTEEIYPEAKPTSLNIPIPKPWSLEFLKNLIHFVRLYFIKQHLINGNSLT
jgi:hypothetical protein